MVFRKRPSSPPGLLRWLIFSSALLLASCVQAEPCLVVGISDGDTLTARCGEPGEYRQVKVRLAEIDAPEKAQPFGERSRQSLAEMCFGQTAAIRRETVDRYGRTVARVACQGMDANAEQVRRGMAWVYRRYQTDSSLTAVEAEARRQKAGLWADAQPVAPWDWRRK